MEQRFRNSEGQLDGQLELWPTTRQKQKAVPVVAAVIVLLMAIALVVI